MTLNRHQCDQSHTIYCRVTPETVRIIITVYLIVIANFKCLNRHLIDSIREPDYSQALRQVGRVVKRCLTSGGASGLPERPETDRQRQWRSQELVMEGIFPHD